MNRKSSAFAARGHSYDDSDTWIASMQHIALEGRCFVLTACQFVRKKDFPDTVRVSLGD